MFYYAFPLFLGKQFFAYLVYVFKAVRIIGFYEFVSQIQNILARPVVFNQRNLFGFREIFVELDNISTNPIVPLVDDDYSKNKIIKFDNAKFSDKYHPKQIIYVIEYHSKKQQSYKYTVIIPKINKLDIKKNKFGEYFNKMINKIRDKGGHIYTCYWFAWDSTHDNFKEIEI